MKTTLDLPDDLVEAIKLHALHEQKKLKDAVADLLRKGLAAIGASPTFRPEEQTRPVLKRHPDTGLLYVECRHPAAAAQELSNT